VDPTYFKTLFAAQVDTFNFFNAITGGSFEDFSVFALSITPYITSSIIIQLLTIAIPKLEEMQKDGEDGRKKIAELTRYVTVALALIQSIALSVGFGNRGLLTTFNWQSVVIVVLTLTAGSAFLMWVGERITENGVGNGISIILLVNILSRMPNDFNTLYETFIKSKSTAVGVVAAVIILAIVIAIVAFVVLLTGATRKIPVQYSQKVQGRKLVGGQSSHIPLKVNTAGVIPVIFASSLMSFPVIIAQFFEVNYESIGGKILLGLSSSNWCNPDKPIYSIGLLVYIALIIVFAYFYTSITFNPLEVANNMKKQGGFIPGIRPGKPTSDYLNKILNYIVLIGAVGLVIVAILPIIFSGVFGIGALSFGGTSIIIVVGVVLETLKQIESRMLVRNYKGFLTD
ncbi:MAG: preprotein translocase subunit SecY, partial [Lachnospiraceae bacterium]